MTRSNRLALLGAAVLVLVVAGSALANRSPSEPTAPAQVATDPEDETPAAETIDRVVERLRARGVEADRDELADLLPQYGLGGAVRLHAWSDETGLSVADLRAMRDGGMGWGVMARELGVHPGIGSVMGKGGGHGRDHAPGQQKDRDADE